MEGMCVCAFSRSFRHEQIVQLVSIQNFFLLDGLPFYNITKLRKRKVG